ncbi:MAG TPA: hypothetical protein ENI27_05880 [bacterium]|nr:hypothetical protein [bacterium]
MAARMFLVFFCLVIGSFPVCAETVSLNAARVGDLLVVSIALKGGDAEQVLASIQDGLKSEIVFQARLYERNRGLFSFLGDRVFVEREVVQVAYFDFFDDMYVVESELKGTRKYEQREEFLRDFFHLADFSLQDMRYLRRGPGSYYILARIRLDPVRLVPPLNIISLFNSSVVTPWQEIQIPGQRGLE